jgi:CRP-like cAMP-binding protein
MHTFLFQVLHQLVELTKEEEKLLASLFKEQSLKKGEFFLKSDSENTRLGFIVKGLLRYFVYKDEEESTLEFSGEGEFVGEYQSLTEQKPAIQNIQAIEDSTLLTITYQDLQIIYDQTSSGNKIGRMVLEHRFNVLVRQLLSIYMHTPDQRYVNFISTYPGLQQRIPQYYIASYVGVRPESLSRIRKRMTAGIS